MEKDFFLDSFNELGNPKYPSFLTYLRNSVDRTVYAVYKNPTDKELDRVRRIEKRYKKISWGFRYGIYNGDKYVWTVCSTHEEVEKKLIEKGLINGEWHQKGDMD